MKEANLMTRGKWVLVLVLLLGTLILVGCGGSDEKTPAPDTEQTQNKEEPKVEAPKVEEPKAEAPKVEEPKVEAPKAEAPKVEAPKAEVPKVEAPKAEVPKPASKPALNLAHDMSAAYANCKTCHAGKAMLSPPPQHTIDASTASCSTCHTLNPKA